MSVQQMSAQSNQYTSVEDSDPEATAILDEIKSKFNSYKSVGIDFSLEINIPDELPIKHTGTLTREGKKYNMETDQYVAICDGTAIWMVIKDQKEVQINDMPEEDEEAELFSPEGMLTFYEKGKFVYVLANAFMEDGIPVQQIEFKPLDPYSDYSKLRLTLNKKTKDIVRIEAFGKDATQYTLAISKIIPNKPTSPVLFAFDEQKYSGFHIEDLRE